MGDSIGGLYDPEGGSIRPCVSPDSGLRQIRVFQAVKIAGLHLVPIAPSLRQIAKLNQLPQRPLNGRARHASVFAKPLDRWPALGFVVGVISEDEKDELLFGCELLFNSPSHSLK